MGLFKSVKKALGGGDKKAAAEAQAAADRAASIAERARLSEAVKATQGVDETDVIRRRMQEQFGGRKSRAAAVLIGSPTAAYNRERLG